MGDIGTSRREDCAQAVYRHLHMDELKRHVASFSFFTFTLNYTYRLVEGHLRTEGPVWSSPSSPDGGTSRSRDIGISAAGLRASCTACVGQLSAVRSQARIRVTCTVVRVQAGPSPPGASQVCPALHPQWPLLAPCLFFISIILPF